MERLLALGAPRRGIRLLTGSRLHDVRDERVGTYAGGIDPDAPVGRFAGRPRRRCQGTGSFAGDPDRQRKGSFADVERDVIMPFGRPRRAPARGHDDAVRQLLRRSLDPRRARGPAVVDALHTGHAVVIAEIAEIAPAEARARLDAVAPAA